MLRVWGKGRLGLKHSCHWQWSHTRWRHVCKYVGKGRHRVEHSCCWRWELCTVTIHVEQRKARSWAHSCCGERTEERKSEHHEFLLFVRIRRAGMHSMYSPRWTWWSSRQRSCVWECACTFACEFVTVHKTVLDLSWWVEWSELNSRVDILSRRF